MSRSDIDTIDQRQKRLIPRSPEGLIVSVNVVVAMVQRMGSSQLVPCTYDPQQGVAVGKRCTFEWVKGRNKYVIKSVFSGPNQIISPDQNPSAFELAPPNSVAASDGIAGAVLLVWNVPVQRSVTFEVQVNTSASESGAVSYYTRAGGILLPTDSTLHFRVRSITEDWRYSSWTAWDSQAPGAGGGGGSEGPTDEEILDLIASFVTAGANISVTHDDSGNTLTIAVTSLDSGDLSDFSEAVDDRVNALLQAGANVSLTYNDSGNTLTIAVTGLDEVIDDRVNALITAGVGLVKSYDDGAGTYTLDVNIPELTAESTINPAADYLMMWDASASAHRKILIEDLPTGSAAPSVRWEILTFDEELVWYLGDLVYVGVEL